MFNPLRIFFPKKIVGVDLGTDAVKLVELSLASGKPRLSNYGEMKQKTALKKTAAEVKAAQPTMSTSQASLMVRQILDEAKIKTKGAIFSIPDFLTFCTAFEIPQMPEKEIPGAVRFNASQYITLPITEVTLDWRIISLPGKNSSTIKVFIVAIPNQVIEDYKTIARDANLELYAVEAEVFGIARSLVKDNKKTICLLDIGSESSTLNIVDQGFLKKSYSADFSSDAITSRLMTSLKLNYEQAQEFQNKEGLRTQNQVALEALNSVVNPFFEEIKSVLAEFAKSDQKQIEEFYLAGGVSNMPGLKEYFSKIFTKDAFYPNCFSGISHPSILKDTLQEMSSRFSVAVGMALDGLDI